MPPGEGRFRTLLFNSSPILEAHFGVPAAGGILVAINNRLAGPEIGHILGHSGARFLLLDAELEPLVPPPALASLTVLRCARGDADSQYEQCLAVASGETPGSWLADEEETISINYTSRTTGQPKGVQYSYPGAYLNALSEVIVAGMSPESVYLWTLPMFHCNGRCFPDGNIELRDRSTPLPKTSTGKVQKFALREREWTGRETRVGTT